MADQGRGTDALTTTECLARKNVADISHTLHAQKVVTLAVAPLRMAPRKPHVLWHKCMGA